MLVLNKMILVDYMTRVIKPDLSCMIMMYSNCHMNTLVSANFNTTQSVHELFKSSIVFCFQHITNEVFSIFFVNRIVKDTFVNQGSFNPCFAVFCRYVLSVVSNIVLQRLQMSL